eukprot:c29012_g2_i3 orf=406-1305(-)
MPLLKRGNRCNEEPCSPQEQQAKVDELRLAIGPLSGRALKFCSDDCLQRYLRARNWNVQKSKKMLLETLHWRASFKPEEIQWEDVAKEGETGKVYKADFVDKAGRTVLVLVPGNQNTSSHEGQIRHLVYLLENAIFNLPLDQEQMVWLIDFKGWSLTNAVPVRTAHETANILQNHYPERLASAILYNPPRIFEAFWKVVRHFLDSKTFQKVKFVYSKNLDSLKLLNDLFDSEKLDTAFGGQSPSPYNHAENGKRMQQDDVKKTAYWQLDDTTWDMARDAPVMEDGSDSQSDSEECLSKG